MRWLGRVGMILLLGTIPISPSQAGVGTWTGGGPEGGEILDLEFDPSEPGRLYALTKANGVFRLEPAAQSWIRANRGAPALLSDFAVATDAQTLYATVRGGGESTSALVWVSNDRGSSWVSCSSPVPGVSWLAGVATPPGLPDTVIVVGYEGAGDYVVHRSDNRGASWSEVSRSISFPGTLKSYASHPNLLIMFPRNRSPSWSTDFGVTWSTISVGEISASELAVDPRDDSHFVHIGYGQVLETWDRGESWVQISELKDPYSVDHNPAVAFDALDSKRLVITTLFGSLLSEDGGLSWRVVTDEIRTTTRVVVFDPESSGERFVLGSYEGIHTFASAADSRQFKHRGWQLDNQGLEARSPLMIQALQSPEPGLFLGGFSMGPWRSLDAGFTWQPSKIEWRGIWIYAFAQRRNSGDAFLLYGTGYRSRDHGETWTDWEIDAPTLSTFTGITIEPDGAILVGGTAGFGSPAVHRSTDDGRTWEPVFVPNDIQYLMEPESIAVDPMDPARIFVGSWSWGQGCIVHRTIDNGQSWEKVVSTFLPYCNVVDLEIDPRSPNRVFALGFRGSPNDSPVGGGGTLLRSVDGGSTWERIGESLSCIRSMTLHPENSDLYVGCDRVYVSHDAGETFEVFDRTGLPEYVGLIGALDAARHSDQLVLYAGTNAGLYSYTFDDVIFADAFETGDTSAWSNTVP